MISNYAYIICIIFHKVTRICVKCMIQHELQHCRRGGQGKRGWSSALKFVYNRRE